VCPSARMAVSLPLEWTGPCLVVTGVVPLKLLHFNAVGIAARPVWTSSSRRMEVALQPEGTDAVVELCINRKINHAARISQAGQ